MEKKFKISNKQSAQKVPKEFFHLTDTNVYRNSIFCYSFFVTLLSLKYKDFLISSNLSQFFTLLFYFIIIKSAKQKCNISLVH